MRAAEITIGDGNQIQRVRIKSGAEGLIVIGDFNQLHQNLNLNNPFPGGEIYIGHHNSLGRDGGGVISSSYRFGRDWRGDVYIGSHVQTTRGAEILGFSVLGWPLEGLKSLPGGGSEAALIKLICNGSLRDLAPFLKGLTGLKPSKNKLEKPHTGISLFGVVKVKRCILTGDVTVKDDSVVRGSFIRDTLIQERCEVFYSSIAPPTGLLLAIDREISTIARRDVKTHDDLTAPLGEMKVEEYPASDAEYYGDTSYDDRLKRLT